ncbi:MAG: nucleoside hydrolase [Candidatus Rokubacteria bacterium]|nr:nucleoside hydrolase [Candidatus Rokubacteria bacterium]
MTPTIIDTDPGIDDALALLFAWGSPELEVEALTTVAGNVPLALATVNAWRVRELCRPAPAPVIAEGAAAPLRRPLRTAADYHGQDGLGDIGGWPETPERVASGQAVDVMIDAARRHRRRLVLIAIGPLTNVALALERDAEALRAIGRLVIMGGAVDVPGNVTPDAEFNIHVDPDAARRVFEAGLPIDLVPLDATRQAILRREELSEALARTPGPVAERIAAFTAFGFRERGADGTTGLTLHDPLAVGVAADPTLATWDRVRLIIGADGETRRRAGAPNCRVAVGLDRARFVQRFLERLCPRSA